MTGVRSPAILADDANATAADVLAGVYLMGEINQNRITFDPKLDAGHMKPALRPCGIFLRDSVQAPSS
jgi:hypothetical protein